MLSDLSCGLLIECCCTGSHRALFLPGVYIYGGMQLLVYLENGGERRG